MLNCKEVFKYKCEEQQNLKKYRKKNMFIKWKCIKCLIMKLIKNGKWLSKSFSLGSYYMHTQPSKTKIKEKSLGDR